MVTMPCPPGDGTSPTHGAGLDCVSRDRHADISKFPRLHGPPVVRKRPPAETRGIWPRSERPRTRHRPEEAQVGRLRGGRSAVPHGWGWTAVSRAATLLVCAAFCLEPCQDNHPGGSIGVPQIRTPRDTVAYRSSASAAPVLGRTHLGSFPPCEDQPYVERLRPPPCLFRQDHRAT